MQWSHCKYRKYSFDFWFRYFKLFWIAFESIMSVKLKRIFSAPIEEIFLIHELFKGTFYIQHSVTMYSKSCSDDELAFSFHRFLVLYYMKWTGTQTLQWVFFCMFSYIFSFDKYLIKVSSPTIDPKMYDSRLNQTYSIWNQMLRYILNIW